MTQDKLTFNHSIYHRVPGRQNKKQCELIAEYFYHALATDAPALEKSHFFHGRYENIYLKDKHFTPLNTLLNDAKEYAANILKCTYDELGMDYWFNDMPPKHITDWHRHDVMDEQLSGVFYLVIPENSGHLLLKGTSGIERVIPKQNDFVFFMPDIEHFVEENKSPHSRLSIGMNFGYLADKE